MQGGWTPLLDADGDAPSASATAAPPSNQRVLLVVTASFALFVCAELTAALLSHSLSLLGDAGAMSVDVFSYLTNMLAERFKSAGGGELTKRQRLLLEVVVPSFSVVCLLAVTAWITVEAVQTLTDTSSNADDEDVNIYVLWGFSSLNAIVDVVSFYMFYQKGREVFYHVPAFAEDEEQLAIGAALPLPLKTAVTNPILRESKAELLPSSVRTGDAPKKNLNMISAFSHVGGDTLRTLSIFFAAAYASITGAPGYLVDAWASAIVTVTIVAMVVPLLVEIVKAAQRIALIDE